MSGEPTNAMHGMSEKWREQGRQAGERKGSSERMEANEIINNREEEHEKAG